MSVGLPLGYAAFPVAAGFAPVAAGGGHPTSPGAPTGVSAMSANASAIVSFNAPVNTGGASITTYTVTASPGGATASGAASPITVPGLVNGTTYTFTVTATNAIGTGPASAPSAAITPSTVPGVPIIGTATAFNGYATVSFSASGNGGSPILNYTAISIPGSITATGTSSPITIPGLTNGTNYTFEVLATNANGSSAYSGASNSVQPGPPTTVPGAPTGLTAFPGNAQVAISFTAPATGGASITGYTATSVPGGFTGTNSVSPVVVTGLTNGTPYTFTVTATNSVGTGPASAPSTAVTPATVPGVPLSPVATKGNASASVAFSAPTSNGGASITGYTAISSPGSFSGSGSASPVTVSGLSNGTAYTFVMVATNSQGTGAASAVSNSVTPSTVPGAPTGLVASGGNAQASIAFTAAASNGGAAITSYTVTSSPGSKTGTGSASPITVTGLTNGTAYTFTAKATNSNGAGAASAASNSVTPSSAALALAINSSGKIVNASGVATQIYGGNVSGLEYVAIEGYDPSDPWGGVGQLPVYSSMATWGLNIVRVPINVASWLGLTVCPTASQSITFTTAPASSTTSGTLTSPWGGTSGPYPITNSNVNWSGTFTNGSTAVTWSALSATASSATVTAVVWGTPRSADPGSNYQSTVITTVKNLNAVGCCVIIDLHWTAPQLTFGTVSHYLANTGQSAAMDETAIACLTSLAAVFGTNVTPQAGVTNASVAINLTNEPYLNAFSGTITTAANGGGTVITDKDAALLSGGYSNLCVNQSQGGSNFSLATNWQMPGYQAMVTAWRGTGAQNVLIVSGNQYSQQLNAYAKYTPTDTLTPAQIAYDWHAYPNSTTYAGETANPYPQNGIVANNAGTSANMNNALSLIAAGLPLMVTEDGSFGGTSYSGASPHMTYMINWCEARTVPYIYWQYNNPQAAGTSSTQNYAAVYVSGTSGAFVAISGEGTAVFP